MFKIVIYIVAFLTLNSCANSVEFAVNPSAPAIKNIPYKQTVQYQDPGKKVDILLVVDNSGSMVAAHKKMIDKFKGNFVPYLKDLDWRMGVFTTDPEDDGLVSTEDGYVEDLPSGFGGELLKLNANGDKYFDKNTQNLTSLFQKTIKRIGCYNIADINPTPLESDKALCLKHNYFEEPFASIIKSINKKDAENSNFFRNKAHLATIIISDEDESSGLAAQDVLSAVKKHWPQKILRAYNISNIVNTPFCAMSAWVYGKKLTQLSQITEGDSLSICSYDYTTVFSKIGKGIYHSFFLKINLERIVVPGSLKLTLDPEPTYDFQYTVNNQQILFQQPLTSDTTITIEYLTPDI